PGATAASATGSVGVLCMTLYVVPIVEGQTEAGCIERLLQRVWIELLASPMRLQVLAPSRGKRDELINPIGHSLANKIEEAYLNRAGGLARDRAGRGSPLRLLEAEGDRRKAPAPCLLRAARHVGSDTDLACVLARGLLENGRGGGAPTLGGIKALPATL